MPARICFRIAKTFPYGTRAAQPIIYGSGRVGAIGRVCFSLTQAFTPAPHWR